MPPLSVPLSELDLLPVTANSLAPCRSSEGAPRIVFGTCVQGLRLDAGLVPQSAEVLTSPWLKHVFGAWSGRSCSDVSDVTLNIPPSSFVPEGEVSSPDFSRGRVELLASSLGKESELSFGEECDRMKRGRLKLQIRR